MLMNTMPPSIPSHQEEARIQAVVTIGHFLEGLGEPGWRSVLFSWLARYDGLETYLYVEDDPLISVRNLLAHYVEILKPAEPGQLAADLSGLPFCRYRAKRRDGKKWEPLSETFTAFCEGVTVEVWESEGPYPRREVLQNWLLTQFCTAQVGSRRG